MHIRRVDIADAAVQAGIDSMIAECFTPEDWQTNQLPRAKTGLWWVAFDGRTPAAFACMRPSIRWEHTGYLAMSGVLKSYRKRGLQKRLIRKRVAHARELGWHTVITDTMHDNPGSMRALIACGFRPYTPHVRWGDPEHAVYWIRSTEPRLSV